MGVVTIFLLVLGFALIIGNILITILEPEDTESKKIIQQNQTNLITPKPIQETINYNKLIKTSISNIESKIKNLENFKANTEIELKAMKEILLELQKQGKTVKAKKFKKKLSEKELKEIESIRKIVFNKN